MADHRDDRVEEALRRVFPLDPHSPADKGFSEAVVVRVRRRQLARRVLLGAAVLVGALVASAPVMELVAAAGSGLQAALAQWTAAGTSSIDENAASAVALIALAFLFTRALED
jgi:hypothetical protein